MKKYIFLLLIVFLCLTIAPTFALAETVEQQISALARENAKVIDAKTIVYQRNCLIAIQTEKFTNKSEYLEYIEKLEGQIKDKFEIDNVFVTRSPKAMIQIERLEKLDKTERDECIKQLVERYLNKPMPLPFVKPPHNK